MRYILIIMMITIFAGLWADLDFAKDLFNDQLYDEAIKEFEKVVFLSPTSPEAQEATYYIGRSYLQKNQLLLAENSFRKLAEGFPNSFLRAEALHYLMLVYFKQDKFREAVSVGDEMLVKYTLSKFTEKSLETYLQSYLEMQDYTAGIQKGLRLIRDYQSSEFLPDMILKLAKLYFAANMAMEGRNQLDRIFVEFPSSNAYWKAVQMNVEQINRTSGKQAAADFLSQKLTDAVPRLFEEPLRFVLAESYLQLEQFDKAYLELNRLINKFNQSEDLPEYILLFAESQIKTGRYQELISDMNRFRKILRNNPLQAEYYLKQASAHLMINEPDKAKEFIDLALEVSSDERVIYLAESQRAELFLKRGQIMNAVRSYIELLNNAHSDKVNIFLQLGDIHYEKLSDYSAALNYYNRILISEASIEQLNLAKFKIASCLEFLGDYTSAIHHLQQIDQNFIKNEEMKNRITAKISYLESFKKADIETAFNKLLTGMIVFSEDNNRAGLKAKLVEILVEDIKDYELALQILEEDNSYEGIYKKSRIILKLMARHRAEGKMNLYEKDSQHLSQQINRLNETTHTSWITELLIKRTLLEINKPSQILVNQMEDYIAKYADGEAINEFRSYLYNYFLQEGDTAKAASLAAQLQNDGSIAPADYFRAKITLAENYFQRNLYDQALRNYRLADDFIDINTPQVMFNFARTLNETGNTTEAKDKLEFLVNNAGGFADYKNVIYYFTAILRSIAQFESSIQYLKILPEEYRDDDYWKQLADDYLTIGDVDNGKYALMRIMKKDYQILSRLGNLQFETGEYEMAKFTFSELIERDKNDLANYEILGRIAFIQEDYLEAAKKYKVIVDKLGDKYHNYRNIKQVAKENIVSLYRIDNRPKAETLTKKFKNVLDKDDMDEIDLHSGIYQIRTDKRKAIDIFSSLIKNRNVNNNTKVKAYFWRGTVYLEQNELTKAEADFNTVANSIDQRLSNQAHLKLGTIKFSEEKFDQALDHYYLVIQNDESGKLALDAARNFAYVCKTIEEWQKAIAAYEIILERWGDQQLEGETIFDIAYCHYRDRKFKNAAAMFARSLLLLENKELQAEAQYWIGESYRGMDDLEQAVSEFLKVAYNYPNFTQWAASAELKAGETYMEMNKPTRARQIYERIIDKYGRNSQWGKEAERRLNNL